MIVIYIDISHFREYKGDGFHYSEQIYLASQQSQPAHHFKHII